MNQLDKFNQSVMKYDLPQGKIYVGGIWKKGGGNSIQSYFPADRTINGELTGANDADIDQAIEYGQKAVKNPAWANLLPYERASILYRIAEGIKNNVERIAYIQTRDTGKTLTETRALANSAAGTFRYFAAVLETAQEALTPSRGAYMTFSRYEPIGLVSAITPWNSPIASDAQKVAPALAAGNAVLLKPSSWSPLVCLELARIIDEAGLPKGLFSALPGSGSIVGERLVTDPAIGRISFTGGTNVGHEIAIKAASRFVPVSLELGGKSPTIVFEDADINMAIAGVLYGIFSSSGQSCIAGSRLLVQKSIYPQFVKKLVEATKALKIGHPFDPQTQVAPLIHDTHRMAVEEWVERARQEGGKILTGGMRPKGEIYEAGCYFSPTIIEGLPNHSSVCREEIFGPVLVVMPFSDETEAVTMANDNAYGLACGVWSKDVIRALRVGQAITTGTVWVNTYKQFSISTSFGGVKESGCGREKGIEGLRSYMNQKSYYIDTSQKPLGWVRFP
ncbi:MAG: aldehyde dehydrogenase [Commensalibacter sp.]|nr:aldehyde dehydrogenase [Commensalibacter sp.]